MEVQEDDVEVQEEAVYDYPSIVSK